jgi:hypothetical protein
LFDLYLIQLIKYCKRNEAEREVNEKAWKTSQLKETSRDKLNLKKTKTILLKHCLVTFNNNNKLEKGIGHR